MLCVYEDERMLCATQMCVCVCVAEHEDTLDDPLSPGDCVEPASRGEAAITTSWALSGRWPTLYSTRPATLTDRQTDRQTGSMTDRKTGGQEDKRHSMWIYLTHEWIGESCRLAPNSWKQERATDVIGRQQRRSGVNGLIWGLTPFKTNLRLCVIVPLTKFLTWSV